MKNVCHCKINEKGGQTKYYSVRLFLATQCMCGSVGTDIIDVSRYDHPELMNVEILTTRRLHQEAAV